MLINVFLIRAVFVRYRRVGQGSGPKGYLIGAYDIFGIRRPRHIQIDPSCIMSGDSQATFSTRTRTNIGSTYNRRCAICLLDLTKQGSQCSHLFDCATAGATQVGHLRLADTKQLIYV
jgi:hypothetical protein